jgi:hypothetical protein
MMRRTDLRRLPRDILSVPQDVTGSLAHEASERRWNARRRERWPPPDPISKPGRIAGYTTAGCLVVTSGAFLVASWDDLVCTHDCLFPPGLAALVWFIAVPIGLAGLAIARRVSLRPTQSDGSTSWTLSLVILFSGGIAVAATRLPSFTCSVGHLDPNFRVCIEAVSGRFSNPSNWIWLKALIGLDDRDCLTAAQACLPRRSSRRCGLALRFRLAPSRHRGSWGTSLVELRPARPYAREGGSPRYVTSGIGTIPGST